MPHLSDEHNFFKRSMASAVVYSLAQTMDQSVDLVRIPISDYGYKQTASLDRQVTFLREFLEESPQEDSRLETRIRDAANEAEDIIEHFLYEQIMYQKSMESSGDGAATSFNLYDLRELETVIEEISSIAREAMSSDAPTVESLSSSSATLPPTHVDGFTVGLDDDLKIITKILCEGTSRLAIRAITGMGGIGKTTLARNAYNHDFIKGHFHVRAWVTVSHDYKIDNILSHLLDSLKEAFPHTYAVSNSEIHRILSRKKYLIVLDDVWSKGAWDGIQRFLPREDNGSRVLITTRQKGVADELCRYYHEMGFLDENQSWILLKKKVFPNKECPPALHNIGKEIVKDCGGLPLAIVLAADALSAISETPQSWKKVAENVNAAIAEPFDKIMSSSYIHLPRHLRPCFLYIGAFPKDYEIRVSKLVILWIAEGFLRPHRRRSLKWMAEEYLEDLVNRNLALVTKRKSDGSIKSCDVHVSIRGMCRRKARDENLERRLSIAHPDLRCVAKVYGSTLRSVTCFQPSDTSIKSLRKFRLLRVLDVVDADVYSLPDQVFDLFHLRYLAFGCPMEIPAAISRLQSLRFLIINPGKRLRHYSMDEVYLPLQIWRLPLLTVLVSFFDLLPNPEGAEASAPLEELLTLSVVKKLICTKELMKMIPNVQKLGITYFGDKYQEDYQLENLVFLAYLSKLKLVMKADSPVGLKINPVFPKTLWKLTLSGWRCGWEDLETVGALPNLQVLKLRDHACEGDTWETTDDQFLSLEYLLIDTSDLEVWVTGMHSFPRLKHLRIYRCHSLRGIPYEVGEQGKLELIEADCANEDLVECFKRIQEIQEERYGYHNLQVSISFSKFVLDHCWE